MIEQLHHESLADLVADILKREWPPGEICVVDLAPDLARPVHLPRLSVAQLKIYSRVKYVCVQQFKMQTLAAILASLQFEQCASIVLHGLWEQLSVVYSEILTTPEPSYVSEFSEYKLSIVVLVLYKLQILSESKKVVLSDGGAVVERLGAIFVSKNDILDDVKRFRVQNLVSVEQLASQYGISFSKKAEIVSGTGSVGD
ncbi:hypothetical protein KL936_003506 [Ogataea polymorpha]|uniref:uncharacterized protein n=1 Tax=Ogataea polymorpha TaxID=460523 RepID=UPI0007F484B1|nr:uncharacterized protein OGAPODRAFT_7361 [Ogataea polymorpha]KAG7888294.1 hypothetical protein KL936_003506 [Ogataea polymorpha]OBA17877.1 hypothetical protein OGAPODRAFT_7361 [Ogataea polymorpha]